MYIGINAQNLKKLLPDQSRYIITNGAPSEIITDL